MPLAPALSLQKIKPAERVLAAVSGGLDSVTMLHALVKAGYRVGVAHVNFGLRGAESDADEDFVRELAKRFGVPFFSTRFQTEAYASEQGISTQMAARELRYQWFEEVRQQELYDLVATAHHQNDSLETALLNLVRGTGPAGLTGIKERSGNLWRPVLSFSRTEMEAYAHKNNLTWRDDSSNASDYYKRNFLRHRVIPLLQELNPNLLHTFRETSLRMGEAQELIQHHAGLLGLEEGKPGFWRIRKGKLAPPVNALVLHQALKNFGFTYRQVTEILEYVNGQSGKRFLSPTHELVIDRDELFISAKFTSANRAEISVSLGQRLVYFGDRAFHFLELPAHGYTFLPDPATAAFDLDKLKFPLVIRPWHTGDRFRPLGMKGRKLVSDLLIDRKVPLPEKQKVLVLVSGVEIAWVLGHQISDSFKLTPASHRVLEVCIQENGPQ